MTRFKPFRRIGLCAIAVMVGGCQGVGSHRQARFEYLQPAALRDAVQANLQAIGGQDVWRKGRIEAQAVATLTDSDGGHTLVSQDYHLALGSRPGLTVESRMPDGVWVEQLSSSGEVTMSMKQGRSNRPGEAAAREGARLKLRLLVHALTQTTGLWQKGWAVNFEGTERRGGKVNAKIALRGPIVSVGKGQDDLMVIWLDAKTHLVNRIWLRYSLGNTDAPKWEYLAADVAEYRTLANGMQVPGHVGIFRSDAYQQVSEREIMRVEFQQVTYEGSMAQSLFGK